VVWRATTSADSLALGAIAMLDWKTDLNTLIEETKTFAKSVRVEPMMPRTVVESNRVPSVNWAASEREEIGRHIANFKAHQQRFKREREDYAASEFKRMIAPRY
jgi:hypothetical protein